MRRRRVLHPIPARWFWGGWAAFGLLGTALTWLAAARVGQPGFHPALPVLGMGRALLFAGQCLAAFAVARAFPLDSPRWRRNLLLTVALNLAAVVALNGGWALARPLLGLRPVPVGPYVVAQVAGGASIALAFVGVAHGLEYFGRYRERELAASRLEAQLAQAHLQVLKAQLQPHFLFNAFHSISALMFRDPAAADRMLGRLAELLRLTLERQVAQEVTLQEELDALALYLEIEQTRFSDRLRVRLEVDDDVRSALVPHLLLQPLAENAIRHGISRRRGPGLLQLSAARDGGELWIEVRDNGPGLAAPRRAGGGIGLGNTRERLEQLYGDAHELTLCNAAEGGAVATLRLPLRLAPEGAGAGKAGSVARGADAEAGLAVARSGG